MSAADELRPVTDLDAFYERQKELHGRSATFLWLGLGAIVFATEPAARFLSWQAAVFFIAGMFVAAVVFGWIGYGAQRLAAKAIIKLHANIASIRAISLVLYVADAVLIYFAARWVVRALF